MLRATFLNKHVPGNTQSHKRAKKQEVGLAKRLKGHLTPGSGNKSIKGDVRVKGIVRIEAKTTQNKSFSVTLKMIEQIENAALSANELPIIAIEFNDGFGNRLKDICVCPSYVLEALCEKIL